MKAKKLLPIEVESQKEMFGGAIWNSGDNMWDSDIPELELIGGGGGNDWGDFWRDFNPRDEYPDYGGGGSSTDGDNNGGGEDHRLKKDVSDPCTQVVGTGECSLLALDVISKYFDGDKMGINKDDFIESIGYNFISTVDRIMLKNEGLDTNQIDKMVDNFFINEKIGDIQSMIDALDKQHPILGLIKLEKGDGHAVVITGYNSSTNMITVKDSLAPGGEKVMEYNSSMFVDKISISGFKDNSIVKKYKKDANDWWGSCTISNKN